MIQDIRPYTFHNEYFEHKPKADSVVLIFKEREILVKSGSEEICYPLYADYSWEGSYTYLFSIDSQDYFFLEDSKETPEGYEYRSVQTLRTSLPKHLGFAGITGYQLSSWYRNNTCCGRCGNKMEKDHTERMLRCPHCGNIIYPKISPAVIVGVINKDRLLMTKYAHGIYKRYSLIAGFTEIGETLEETVAREVMEEAGLKVKNIRYYKSQPWSFSDTVLMGFYAELDGEDKVLLDERELSEATWFKREEIPTEPDDISLTNEMIIQFKNGNV